MNLILNKGEEQWKGRKIEQLFFLMALCLWIFYVFQQEMAKYSLYTIVSYNVHEAATFIPLILITAALIWFGYLMVKAVKRQCDRYDFFFLLVLLLTVILLGRYVCCDMIQGSAHVVASVNNVDEQKGEIEIKIEDGQTLVMESPEIVNRMIETDGTKYWISYSWNAGTPEKRTITSIAIRR
ncbi:MAG TPA: hypothetical protein H9909_13730 [Candidatus Mediterraneibacter norfolkensis]|nr:hypothetical protein [Candidatus Mediterraneibacter norfolkensis]